MLGQLIPSVSGRPFHSCRDNDRAVLLSSGQKFVVNRSAAMSCSPLLASLLNTKDEVEVEVAPTSIQVRECGGTWRVLSSFHVFSNLECLQNLLMVHSDPTALCADNVASVMEGAKGLRMNDIVHSCESFIHNNVSFFMIYRSSLV